MINLLLTSLKIPGEINTVASQLGDPGMLGNLVIIAIFLVVIGIYGFLLDRHNMVINLFSGYIGLLVITFSPENILNIGDWQGIWWGRLFVFVLASVITTLILSRSHLFKITYTHNFIVRWWQAVISGSLYSGFLVSVILSIVPTVFLSQFSQVFLDIFLSGTGVFSWIISPVIGILFIAGKRRRPGRPAY